MAQIALTNVTSRPPASTLKLVGPTTLCFDAAQVHVVLGPSGCGKTALLKRIAGVFDGDGTVQIGIAGAAHRDVFPARVGYVVQEGGLFSHLTLAQNVVLPAVVHKRAIDVGVRFAELMRVFAVDVTLHDRRPHALSGGQRQRAAFARALFLDPPVLLLDEPLGALDPHLRHGLQAELRALFHAPPRKTVLMVTHDIAEAAYFADTLTVMDSGAVVEHGAAAALFAHPESSTPRAFMQAYRPPPWTHA